MALKRIFILLVCLMGFSINKLQAGYDQIQGTLDKLSKTAADAPERKQLAYQLVGLTVGYDKIYQSVKITDELDVSEDRPTPHQKALNLSALAASAYILQLDVSYDNVIRFYDRHIRRKDIASFQRDHVVMQRLVFAKAHHHFTNKAVDPKLVSNAPFNISTVELDAFLNDVGTINGKTYTALNDLFDDVQQVPTSQSTATAALTDTSEADRNAIVTCMENARKAYAEAGIVFPHELMITNTSRDGVLIPRSAYHKDILVHFDLENAGVRTVIRNAGLITLSEFPICVYLNQSPVFTNILLRGHFALPTVGSEKYTPNPHSFGIVLMNVFFSHMISNEFISAQLRLVEQNLQAFFPMLPIERKIPGALITILDKADPLGKFLNSLGFVHIKITEGTLFNDGVERAVFLKFTRSPIPLPVMTASAP